MASLCKTSTALSRNFLPQACRELCGDLSFSSWEARGEGKAVQEPERCTASTLCPLGGPAPGKARPLCPPS